MPETDWYAVTASINAMTTEEAEASLKAPLKKPDQSLGACLLANDPKGIGAGMIEARKKGVSWADIAKQFDLPNPSAARKAFTKYTGITDYKAKGQALDDLIKQMAEGVVDTGVKTAAKAVKNVQEAVTQTPTKLVNAPDSLGATHGKSIQKLAEDTGLTPGAVQSVIEKNAAGKGYTAIRHEIISAGESIEFAQIDMIVWNDLLNKANGKVWEAYLKKPTSENGFKAVKQKVLDLHAKGLDAADIAKVKEAPPESVVDAIIKDKWSMPPMGSTKPVIPPPPPPPPVVFQGTLSGKNFVVRDHDEMSRWSVPLDRELTPAQQNAINRYTGSGYGDMNGRLRGELASGTNKPTGSIKDLQGAMKPLDKDTKVVRNVHGVMRTFKVEDLHEAVGTTFRDPGFLSTTIKQDGVFSGNVKMHIDVPAGHPSRYVGTFGSHKHERELLLQRGTKMVITKVQKLHDTNFGESKWEVWAEVIGVEF